MPMTINNDDEMIDSSGRQWSLGGGEEGNRKDIGNVYGLLVVTTLLLNFDHGAIPAALVDIAEEMKLNFTEQSLLGALVFAGLTVASPVAGYLFQRYSPKVIVTVSLIVESLALGFFSVSKTKSMVYMFRFVTGVTQSFPIIYVPVWVDEFAPNDNQTQWMGYVQIAVAGGAMLGYLVAGLVARFGGALYLTWRFNFFLQAVLFVPILLGFLFTKKRLIDVPMDHYELTETASKSIQRMPSFGFTPRKRPSILAAYSPGPCQRLLDSAKHHHHHHPKGFCAQLKRLLASPLFVCMTFALCALYFVVTGVQYWVMQYCMAIFHTSRIAVVLFFTVVSSTAPTLGVWFGGWSCDKLGGYRGGSQLISLKLSLCFALISAIMAIASSMVTEIKTFVAALWICLFAGGSLMPICVGVLMTTVPAYMRSFSSAFSMLIYNLFGYFLAPFLSGVVMDRYG
ncbi:conserved hypothetical protein [Perkinsus marinus ATCC 50983]|uniref:Major facilitator superfamily (MFS) profile domain-containing protein n=1 Tax=Perkinsus marinus (strain ATCC 50983 / TXsc) TaxID=423536 RepID=C5L964_PERM5|nr:conserved hypothetical protein [Perkinsus marinus ATCC 50983]EER06712.1 conserved hypothetical protein [Perkinsus marinus ATCC 50983]|eukprot:XP_002774896.1 conserved hypothetical protein [Perkinsus marinus ATCC 50983]